MITVESNGPVTIVVDLTYEDKILNTVVGCIPNSKVSSKKFNNVMSEIKDSILCIEDNRVRGIADCLALIIIDTILRKNFGFTVFSESQLLFAVSKLNSEGIKSSDFVFTHNTCRLDVPESNTTIN